MDSTSSRSSRRRPVSSRFVRLVVGLLRRRRTYANVTERERRDLVEQVGFWRDRALALEAALRTAESSRREDAERFAGALVAQSREYVEGASRLLSAPSPYEHDEAPPVPDESYNALDFEGAREQARRYNEECRQIFAKHSNLSLAAVDEMCRRREITTPAIVDYLAAHNLLPGEGQGKPS